MFLQQASHLYRRAHSRLAEIEGERHRQKSPEGLEIPGAGWECDCDRQIFQPSPHGLSLPGKFTPDIHFFLVGKLQVKQSLNASSRTPVVTPQVVTARCVPLLSQKSADGLHMAAHSICCRPGPHNNRKVQLTKTLHLFLMERLNRPLENIRALWMAFEDSGRRSIIQPPLPSLHAEIRHPPGHCSRRH